LLGGWPMNAAITLPSHARCENACRAGLLHSLLLVPYFSWLRSHAVTTPIATISKLGETHVPSRLESAWDRFQPLFKGVLGESALWSRFCFVHLLSAGRSI